MNLIQIQTGCFLEKSGEIWKRCNQVAVSSRRSPAKAEGQPVIPASRAEATRRRKDVAVIPNFLNELLWVAHDFLASKFN
jgi:hypothetical protein